MKGKTVGIDATTLEAKAAKYFEITNEGHALFVAREVAWANADSPGKPERERPVSGVISEDCKSGPQAWPAPTPLLSPLACGIAGY